MFFLTTACLLVLDLFPSSCRFHMEPSCPISIHIFNINLLNKKKMLFLTSQSFPKKNLGFVPIQVQKMIYGVSKYKIRTRSVQELGFELDLIGHLDIYLIHLRLFLAHRMRHPSRLQGYAIFLIKTNINRGITVKTLNPNQNLE